MNPDVLDRVLERTLVACLVEQVLERLRARSTTALVLFTGTAAGLGPATAALARLRGEGWDLRPVFSPGARRLLAPEQRQALGEAPAAGTAPEAEQLLAGCGALLVPTLTCNTAAKVAWGIRDSLASSLLAHALERGLPLAAAWDGCCPDHPERAAEGLRAPSAYRARLRANLEALRQFGIHLGPAGTLDRAARHLAEPAFPAPPAMPVLPAPRAEAGAAPERRVFGRGDAVQARAGELRLDRGVLITPLAADELRRRQIRLVRT